MTETHTSETAKYRHLTVPYCNDGCGLDIGSQGDPVVPWAWQLELPAEKFDWYNSGNPLQGPVQLRGDATHIPVDSNALDFVYCSHLLEDFAEWEKPLTEWVRVLKKGGYLIILVPDKERWNKAIENGQPPNCEHRHESYAGELSKYSDTLGIEVIEDRLTDLSPEDYSVLFVAKKTCMSL